MRPGTSRTWTGPGNAPSSRRRRYSSKPPRSRGAGAEREEGEWKVGPTIEVPIPLLNQGQGRLGRAAVEFRRAEQAYYAEGVRVRSIARLVKARVQGAEGPRTLLAG